MPFPKTNEMGSTLLRDAVDISCEPPGQARLAALGGADEGVRPYTFSKLRFANAALC